MHHASSRPACKRCNNRPAPAVRLREHTLCRSAPKGEAAVETEAYRLEGRDSHHCSCRQQLGCAQSKEQSRRQHYSCPGMRALSLHELLLSPLWRSSSSCGDKRVRAFSSGLRGFHYAESNKFTSHLVQQARSLHLSVHNGQWARPKMSCHTFHRTIWDQRGRLKVFVQSSKG